jgi:hypothetical protein
MKKQIFLAAVLVVIVCASVQAQSWWRGFPRDSFTNLSEVIPSEDGNLIMRYQRNNQFNTLAHTYIFKKLNPLNGSILQQDTTSVSFKTYAKSFTTRDKGLVTFILPDFNSESLKIARFDSLNRLIRIDSMQNITADKPANFFKRSDSTFLAVNSVAPNYYLLEIIVFNPVSLSVNYRNSIDRGRFIGIESLGSGYLMFYSRSDTLFRAEINADGTVLNRKSYPNYVSDNSSGIVVKDRQDNMILANAFGVMKFSRNGDLLWKRQTKVAFRDAARLLDGVAYNVDMKIFPNGDCIVAQRIIDQGENFGHSIYKISAQGDSIWWRKIQVPRVSFLIPLLNLTSDGGISIVGQFSNGGFNKTTDVMKFDGNGNLQLSYIQGEVRKDNNNNCRIDVADSELRLGIVEATRTDGEVFRTIVNDTKYGILCDTGNYSIKYITPNALWQNCTPSVSRRISSVGTTDTVDFPVKTLINCPVLTIDLSTNGLRRCFDNRLSVSYCNTGTIPATNAYVDIRLDSLIEFTSATRPLASQNRNVFRFNLGTIGIGECGNFTINGRVRCGDSTRLGQTLCNEAHIYPDSVCLPIGTFSGANLTVSGSCVGDSVQFIVRNVGTATSQNARSVVLEDEVLFMRNSINGLTPNATFSKKYKANGSTWRMVLEQEPNHPTSQFPTAFVEGCGRNGNGGVSTGFGTTFGNDDATPSVSTLCRPIVGSYDPNDKQGFPTGYKSEHFIRQNQDLDYVIRFQNTGTDTAFLVVIRDTLSDVLDISSIEFGGSSHAYEADIYGKNILKFTFKNINLPDSFRNVAASQGFVKFRIKQKKDLAIGTKIKNNAGIYFDFNDPIITNTTLHTVDKDVIITAIVEPNKTPNSLTINVLPNPFTEHATFELLESNTPFNIELNSPKFELYDALGRLLRSEKITNARFDFHRKDLSNGLYFFNITSNGKVLGQGKLMIQ